MDAARLRRLGGGPGRRAHLRDLLGRAGAVDPHRRRCAPGRRRGRGHGDHADLAHGHRPRAGRAAGAVHRRGRGHRPHGGGPARRRRSRRPLRGPEEHRPGHDRLHLGHDGPPQGRRAHPRQPHPPERQHGRPRPGGAPGPRGARAAVPPPGARAGPLRRDRDHLLAGRHSGAHAGREEPGDRPGLIPPDLRHRRAARVREDLQRRRRPLRRRQAEGLPPGRQDRDRLLAGPGHPGRTEPGPAGAAGRLRPPGLLHPAPGSRSWRATA